MVDKTKKGSASPAMGKRGAEHLQARDGSPCGPSRANSKQQCAAAVRYKGVRMRDWGKWVSEISDTQMKNRIWLGSFATEEMAARAYDSAVVSLKGPNATGLNFPDSPPRIVSESRASKDIQAAALAAAMASVPDATPLASSKKKKTASSLLSMSNSLSREYMPVQGEPCNHVQDNSAPSVPKDSETTPATLEEFATWIDSDFGQTCTGPLRPRVDATAMESNMGPFSYTDGNPSTYLEGDHPRQPASSRMPSSVEVKKRNSFLCFGSNSAQ